MIKVCLAACMGRRPFSIEFFDRFYGVQLPIGSVRIKTSGAHVEKGMNSIIEFAFANKCTHIIYVDDDLLFQPDFVDRLLSHNKDRVSPLVTERTPPFRPYCFNDIDADGELVWMPIPNEATGLLEVPIIAGMPGLITTKALSKLPRPCFPTNFYLEDGVTMRQGDIEFGKRLFFANVPCYMDLDCIVEHLAEVRVKMYNNKGNWRPMLYFEEGERKAEVRL